MKKTLTLGICLVAIPLSIFAQNVKKYVLMEHFTNTFCGICAASNPGFYSTIKVETNPDVHHLAIHPEIPYMQCPLYQANMTEQTKRKAFYNVQGTPRVCINGGANTSVGSVTTASLATEVAKTSPLSLKVKEITGTTGRTATITVKPVGDVPTAEYRLFVAVVEKKLNFSPVGGNGESIHYDVFRKFLTSADGDAYTMPSKGVEASLNFNYTPVAPWVADQVYVLAFIQNMTTKEVLNSGTKFDLTSATDELQLDNQVQVSPNPTNGTFRYAFDNLTPQYLTITNIVGQVILSKDNAEIINNGELNLANQPSGVYYLTIKAKEGLAVKKIVKQ
jgi:Outer membrane protein Omp28/Secretion system C-terminal sorting domain